MGKINSKAKGNEGERALARKLKEYGYDCERGVQYQGGPDSPDVKGLPGIHVECKRTEKLSLYNALDQAQGDAGEDSIPAVFHRRNRKPWVVIMELDDWMRLYRVWEEAER